MEEIEILPGTQIEGAYKLMKEYEMKSGKHCFCSFNGKKLLSIYTLDKCYRMVTGLGKEEFDEKVKAEYEENIRKENEFKASIPQKITEYIEKAKGIIPEEKLEKWNEIVPIRLNDLYHGFELDCWLDLISELNKTTTKVERFINCKMIFEKQGHSGMSASLVLFGLIEFHPLGKELAEYIDSIWYKRYCERKEVNNEIRK